MENISLKTDHVSEGISRVISRYRRHPRYITILTGLLNQVQELENAITPLIETFYLINATDWALDQWGIRVGIPRSTLGKISDDDYRVRIYGKIAENISHGTEFDLANLLGAMGQQQIKIWDVTNPAGMTVNFVNNRLVLSCNCIRFILGRASFAVPLDIVMHEEGAFGLAGDLTAKGLDIGKIGESI